LDLLRGPWATYGGSRDRDAPIGEVVRTLSAEIRPDLVDRMIELYCDWRTGCAGVRAAYERFRDASRSDRVAAFAAYVAALDQEQSACELYAEQVRLVASHCTAGRVRVRRRENRERGRA
jgi:hypothetical protein